MAKPTTSTVRNTRPASAAVTTMWLVTVKAPGIMPSMLQTKMKMKSVNTKREVLHARLRRCSRAACRRRTRRLTSAIDCSRLGTSERARIDTMKKPAVSTTASSMNSRRVGEGDVPAEDLDGDERMDLELMDGIGHAGALVAPVRCCHVAPPQSSSSRTVWPEPAAGPGRDFLLHPLVGPHHVEHAGGKPQHEEQQEQPGLRARAASPDPMPMKPPTITAPTSSAAMRMP